MLGEVSPYVRAQVVCKTPDVQIKWIRKFRTLTRANETEITFSFMLTGSRRSGFGTSWLLGVAKATIICLC